MSPEELNRTIDFIIQSQARLVAAQEQDKEWAKGLFAQMAAQDQRLGELIEIQSRRLDEYEKEQRVERRAAEKRHQELMKLLSEIRDGQQEFQIDAQRRHEEALARLDRILEKLTDRMN
jgi:hypothetical protein